MKILKTIGYSTLAVTIISSCTSTKMPSASKVPVPDPIKNMVSISEKKAKLTAYEEKNWQHLDLATDTIPGMSVKKAHEFLKGKKSTPVIVGVVDSGTDLMHEDLKGVAWVNSKEIAGNGIDDDKNGYVDDINGWNFLGDSYAEHMEWERILMNPSVADSKLLEEVKAYQEEQKEEAKAKKGQFSNFIVKIDENSKLLSNHLGKKNFTKEEVKNIKTEDSSLKTAKGFAGFMLSYFDDFDKAKEYFTKEISKADKIISGKNLQTDYRKVVGDNAYDLKSNPGYGNGKTGHSTKGEAHGSHVSGIIGASRNNGKGMNGVANNVKIMAVRSVSEGDEYDKDVALGIRYAVDNGAKVINTSFGKAFSPNKKWVFKAIQYAAKKDVLIVNAAGNDAKNIDVENTYPNDAPDRKNEISDNFLTVGAMSYNYNENLIANFSNYGKINVDVFAPGYQIYSTTPENEYKKFNGTSMASPNTAGVAALIRSYYPELSASQVKHIIMNSGTQIPFQVIKPGSQSQVTPTGELTSVSNLCVSGRIVNAYEALKMADKMVKEK